MQQYRINYPLLIGLIVGSLIFSGVVYGVWLFQIDRKSGWLLSEAEKAIADKDYREASQFYGQYLSIRPQDKKTRIEYANATLDLANQDDVTIEDLRNTKSVVEGTVRERKLSDIPEIVPLRRRLVDFYGRINQLQDALDHLAILLEANPGDAELQVLRAKYLFQAQNYDEALTYSYKLIGFDPKTKTFDLKKATAPHSAPVYSNLAFILRNEKRQPELADQVMDQLVTANPESPEAYIARGRMRMLAGDAEGSKADAEEAYRLKPKDADVLLFTTEIAANGDDTGKAREYLTTGIKEFPDDVRFYKTAARLELKDKKYKEAMTFIDQGIKTVAGSKAVDLVLYKADLQIANDVEGASKTIAELKNSRRRIPEEFIEYYEARIMLAKGEWEAAKDALNKLRPRVTPFGRQLIADVDYNLGLSYEKLGQPELAKEQFERLLQQDPQNAPALAGLERVNAQMGQRPVDSGGSETWQKKVADELKKPKAQQQWTKIDEEILQWAKDNKLDETSTKLLQAQVLATREDFEGAKKMLGQANQLSPDNLPIYRFMVQLERVNPKVGPAQAMKTWEIVNAKFKDKAGAAPQLRIDKADILIATHRDKPGSDELKQELASLTSGIDNWSTAEKSEFWGGMATRYLGLGMLDEARQYLGLAADNQPNNLPLRLALFSLAHDSNDDEGMKQAQDKILEVVGDTNDSTWLYAEARRKLWKLRRHGQADPKAIEEIRTLVNRALEQRPAWHELHALLAETELSTGNYSSALRNYDRAQQTGRLTPVAVAQHIRLLAQGGRYADAGKLLAKIPEASRQTLLGPLYSDILFRTNQVDEALKQAKAASEADPTNPQHHSWYSQLLARSVSADDTPPARRNDVMTQAIKSMEQAVKLRPEFSEAWFELIRYYVFLKNNDMAQKTLRDAQLAMSGDNLPIFLAKANETLASIEPATATTRSARWFDAETMYRAVYESSPDDLSRVQQLAAFYLGNVYQRNDRMAKATPLINQILKAGSEGKVPPSDVNLLWARRMGAKLLSLTGDYQDIVKAEQLLNSNAQDGVLLMEDKLVMADILNSRPEPGSRRKAIAILEEMSKSQQLSEPAAVMLGDLYSKVGSEWGKYQSYMRSIMPKFPNSATARANYADKLLLRGDSSSVEEAAKYVKELYALAPNSPGTFQLTVRLAGKLGNQKVVRDELVRRLQNFLKLEQIDEAQAQMMFLFATLLVDLGDVDTAEQIYTVVAAKNPAKVYDLAKFLGMHRSVEKCFEKLNEIYAPERIADILGVAAVVVREQRDTVGDKFDPDVQRWLETGLRENPDSITLLVIQADILDLQQKYDEAAAVYRKLLARNDLEGMRRAIVLNNLAFLVALQGSAASDVDTMKLVDEAAQILGPNSEILDTRAVVHISRKEYKDAVQDLELAVTDNPTPSKYFHKAQAHLLAGENRAAVEAWEKAEGLGLTQKSLNRMEFDLYEQLKSKIDQLRGGSVTQAEPRRKAG